MKPVSPSKGRANALSYLALGLYFLQGLLPELMRLNPGVRWISTAAAVVAALYRAFDYWRAAQNAPAGTSEALVPTEPNGESK